MALPLAVSPDVDRASAQTAADLSWAAQLLKRELEDYTPEIASRIRYEVNRRLFIPLLSKERLELGGAGAAEMAGIISGGLAAALTLEGDEERRLQLVLKCIQLTGRLLDGESADGASGKGWRPGSAWPGRSWTCIPCCSRPPTARSWCTTSPK